MPDLATLMLSLLLLAIFLLFPIYVLFRLGQLREDLAALKRRVDMVVSGAEARHNVQWSDERKAPAPAEAVAPSPISEAAQPAAPFAPAAAPFVPDVTVTGTPVVPPLPAQFQPAAAVPPLPPESAPEVRAVPSPASQASAANRRDVESMLGANWLAKLGIAAIAVAMAFFLQYAFSHGWIGPRGQVAIGLCIAAFMLGAGQLLLRKERYRSYAQVLASGGIVVYFLSIYAAHSFYHPRLLGSGPAFWALAAGALAASALALANSTEAVALICILGAFATPVMIREGGPQTNAGLLGLYGYIACLNLWVAGLTRLRPWHSLTIVAFTGTWLLFFNAGSLQARGWQTEGFAGLFLLASCYFGSRALYAQKAEQKSGEMTTQQSMQIGLGLIVGGCIAFAIASTLILTGLGLLGLPDVALAGLLLALLLSGLAVALPNLGHYDRTIRLLFGYLSAAALAAMMLTALQTSDVTPSSQVPIAFGFALFNYLLFLVTALVFHRRADEEGPAAALAGSNAVIHFLMTFHILHATRLWGIPALPLWLPMASLLTLGGLAFSVRQRTEARLLPITLIVAAQALPLLGLLFTLSVAGRVPARWPAWSAALIGAEFMLVSAAWIALRRRIAWPNFRADFVAAFGNAAVFFGLMARAVGTERYQGFALLAGCAVAMAVYHAFVGAVVLKQDDRLPRLLTLGLATTFVTIAIPLQLHASYITLAWAVEAAVLVWTGLAVNEARVRRYGLVLLALAGCKALLFDLPTHPQHLYLLFNPRTLAGASVIVAAYLSAWWMSKRRDAIPAAEQPLSWILSLLACLLTVVFVSMDLKDVIEQNVRIAAQPSVRQFALTAFWALYAFGGVCVAGIYRHRPLRLFSVALLFCTVAKALVFDLTTPPEHVSLFLNTRMLAGVLVIAAAYLSAWLFWRDRTKLPAGERPLPATLIVLANVLTLLFVSVDLWDYAGMRWPAGGTASAPQLALSLFWASYAMVGVSVGIWQRLRPVRLCAMGLLYLAIGKVFLFDLRNLETLYRIASFFTLGVILLLVSLLYTRFEGRLRVEEEPTDAETSRPRNLAM